MKIIGMDTYNGQMFSVFYKCGHCNRRISLVGCSDFALKGFFREKTKQRVVHKELWRNSGFLSIILSLSFSSVLWVAVIVMHLLFQLQYST